MKRLWLRFKQYRCEHPDWIPAITNSKPAKHCRTCQLTIILSDPEFYALFGWVWHPAQMTLEPKSVCG
jgi:hypothetical protein